MRLFRPSSRLHAVQFVLAICLPLCCCRLQLAAAMMAAGAEDAAAASCHSACCSSAGESGSQGPSESSMPGHPDSSPRAGSCFCCIKGVTTEKSVLPALTLHLTGLLAPTISESAAPQRTLHADHFRSVRDPGASTLLRLRCALLV